MRDRENLERRIEVLEEAVRMLERMIDCCPPKPGLDVLERAKELVE